MHCEGLSHLPDTQGNTDTRCFCHLNKDVVPNKSGKSCGRDLKTVMAWRQAWNVERPRVSAYDFPFLLTGSLIDDHNHCPGNCAAFLVYHRAGDRSSCSRLCPQTSGDKKRHYRHTEEDCHPLFHL